MATVTDKYDLFIIVFRFISDQVFLRSGQNVASEESRFMNLKFLSFLTNPQWSYIVFRMCLSHTPAHM